MKKIGILFHPLKETTIELAGKLDSYLSAGGVQSWVNSAWKEHGDNLEDTELLITIGGDGTILRAAQAAVKLDIPILGINMGNLGFMTELTQDEMFSYLPDILNGKGWIDSRSMIELALKTGDNRGIKHFYSLNDIVLARGSVARMIYVDVTINSEPLTCYRADGVIVSTATGSTGYSLAAGGPILNPEAKEIILTPILPHLSPHYSLVLSRDTIITLNIKPIHEATLSIDGHINIPLLKGASLVIKNSRKITRFLRVHNKESFYKTLDKKFKGKHN